MNREKIMEMALALGMAIAQDEAVQKMARISAAYDENEEIQTLMTEYNAQTQVLSMEYAKGDGEKDDTMITLVQNRIDEIYQAVSNHPLLTEFNAVQDEVNQLMNRVNGEIQFGMTGKRPDNSCTHDCSTCGGCH